MGNKQRDPEVMELYMVIKTTLIKNIQGLSRSDLSNNNTHTSKYKATGGLISNPHLSGHQSPALCIA